MVSNAINTTCYLSLRYFIVFVLPLTIVYKLVSQLNIHVFKTDPLAILLNRIFTFDLPIVPLVVALILYVLTVVVKGETQWKTAFEKFSQRQIRKLLEFLLFFEFSFFGFSFGFLLLIGLYGQFFFGPIQHMLLFSITATILHALSLFCIWQMDPKWGKVMYIMTNGSIIAANAFSAGLLLWTISLSIKPTTLLLPLVLVAILPANKFLVNELANDLWQKKWNAKTVDSTQSSYENYCDDFDLQEFKNDVAHI